MRTRIHLIAGYLGAGKTTTLLGLLRQLEGERVAVVVNDFGESAIDRALVDASGLAIEEIRGACLCCTAPEGFAGTVASLLDGPAPARIFVEPTGLARPADLVDTLRRAPFADRIDLGPLVVVLDPHQLAGPAGDEVRAQAEVADVVVVNRTDLATPDELAAVDAWLEALWPPPIRVLRTSHGEIPLAALGGGDRPERALPAPDPRHAHAYLAVSRSWPADAVFVRERLLASLMALRGGAAGRAARFKGLLRTEEGVELFELAGDQLHARPSGHRTDSRLDLVLAREGARPEALDVLLAEALRRPDEAPRDDVLELALPDGRRRVFARDDLSKLPGGVDDVAPLVPGRRGAAASLAAVFEAAGVDPGRAVVVVARDGFVTPPVPAAEVRSGWLLHGLDGGPLPAGQGGPFRLLVPGDAGPGGPCANVKGVVRIAVRAD